MEGLSLPNFEITIDCDASECTISFWTWPSSFKTLPVMELTPSSKLFKILIGLKT